MSSRRLPANRSGCTASYTPSTLALLSSGLSMPDWAGLSTTLRNVSTGSTCQSTHMDATRYLAWSKPRFFSRFLLTGTQVMASNSPEKFSAAHWAISMPKQGSDPSFLPNLKRSMAWRTAPS